MSKISCKQLLANPMIQFFAAGAVIFGLYAASGKESAETSETITITIAEQKNLAALFRKTWQRPPTQKEIYGLIENRVREELYYREALSLGLDQNDVVVRRRLVQKMEFIADDLAARRDPTEEELAEFLKANADKYASEPKLTFRQVFLSAERRGPNLMDDAKALLAELARGADPSALGDPTVLPQTMKSQSVSAVSRIYGSQFAEAINDAEPDSWRGPVRSAYGAHLVKVSAKEPGRALTLEEARKVIERDWREAQRQKARAAYTKALKDKYRIVVEQAGSQE
jgi:hypothetical protein